jgi:SAF domain
MLDLRSASMVKVKRWLAASAALVIGGGVSAALLVVANPARDTLEVYVAARDIPAGASLGPDALALERINVASGRTLLFPRGDLAELAGLRAAHDLASGQLIQRSDVIASSGSADRRLVFMPLKDSPVADAGSKVDLLLVGGTTDHPTVMPFALGVEVRSTLTGGLVVVVSSRQAAAFVYAANAMRLTAVIAEAGAGAGAEEPISSQEQAIAAAGQP